MSDKQQYVVEKIVDKRVRRGVIQYLIKWTGCAETENTWEPEKNLNCGALLKQFLQLQKEQKSQPKKRGRPAKSLRQQKVDVRDARKKSAKQSNISVDEQNRTEIEPKEKLSEKTSESFEKQANIAKEPDNKIQKGGAHENRLIVSKRRSNRGSRELAPIEPKKKLNSSKSSNSAKGRAFVGDATRPAKNARRREIRKTQPLQEIGENKADEKLNGFKRGYAVESLIGITQEGNTLLFLVKWLNQDEVELVPSSEVRKFVPEMMIDFYENRIIWNKK